jgi:hypothetical protein
MQSFALFSWMRTAGRLEFLDFQKYLSIANMPCFDHFEFYQNGLLDANLTIHRTG